ncbi:MAG: hypothetical protein WCC22_01175 [Terriglobales bacterium]
MKRWLMLAVLFCSSLPFLLAQTRTHQQGTVVRMRMAECIPQHRLMAALSGGRKVPTGELCPEYVLVTDKVVYTIIGKDTNQLLLLAEITRFRIQHNEMLIRIDDANRESRFHVQEMTLRPEWERQQRRAEEEEAAVMTEGRQ